MKHNLRGTMHVVVLFIGLYLLFSFSSEGVSSVPVLSGLAFVLLSGALMMHR